MGRRDSLVAAAFLFVATTIPALGQALEHPILYRLERESTFARGCFPPCLCPTMETLAVTGTFRLELISIGNVFDFYAVTGVRFNARRSNGEAIPITGSGTYAVSTIADLQRTELQLVVGNDLSTAYISDEVPGGALFPRIAIPISIHGGYCLDTVIDIRARPARRLRVDRNTLSWDATANADPGHDVVQGDLRTLIAGGGSFDTATQACLAHSAHATPIGFPVDPSSGEAFWFLERALGELYEDGDAAQTGSPDDGIERSSGACP